jgi:putative hydrolase of the HAD superfamily
VTTAVRVQDLAVISLDLDDTLWSIEPVILRAEHAMYRFLEAAYPRVTQVYDLDAMRAVRVRVASEHPAMRHDFTFLRIAALEDHARAVGYPQSMATEAFEVFYRARNEVELFPEVEAALARLSRRFALYTLSNGNADLDGMQIGHYFKGRVAARDAGALKPDPAIFARLVEVAAVHAAAILHVGDDPVADVDGARRAGLHAAWLNRHGADWPADRCVPQLTLRTLDDLVSALDA